METSDITANSINQAIESKRRDRDSSNKNMGRVDKYNVKAKDENGKEYLIEYYF